MNIHAHTVTLLSERGRENYIAQSKIMNIECRFMPASGCLLMNKMRTALYKSKRHFCHTGYQEKHSLSAILKRSTKVELVIHMHIHILYNYIAANCYRKMGTLLPPF